MQYIVERIEGDIAVLERDDMEFEDVLLRELPDSVQPGDCLVFENGTWATDPERTEERRARIEKKMKAVFR